MNLWTHRKNIKLVQPTCNRLRRAQETTIWTFLERVTGGDYNEWFLGFVWDEVVGKSTALVEAKFWRKKSLWRNVQESFKKS